MTSAREPKVPINVYDYLVKGDVYISPSYMPGRQRAFAGWAVVRLGYQTDPDAPWYNNGNKVFSAFLHSDGKRGALAEAQQWAEKRYGVTGPWKRNGHGDYLPKGFYRPLRCQVEAQEKRRAKKAVSDAP